ncbi:uncharacterized protein LOC142979062 [Anticarsia gemmatalis]|uniref:uncharacterized protein LOC142979062 n=1 Tax=Anticarsia gemmatalis TaxID=129554 RepID=UPI003F76DC66
MPILDITNPEIIKFLVESYDKTARLRMKWNNLYGDKLRQAATLQREEKGYCEADVLEAAMRVGMATVTRDTIAGRRYKRLVPIRDGVHITNLSDMKKGHSVVDIGLGDAKTDPRLARPDTDETIDPIMRPVDPQQTAIIYKGIPGYGREAYLRSRNKMSPESKYYFNETTASDYGWRLGDSFLGKSGPKYGRVWRLNRDVKSRTGPYPDPLHYKNPDGGPSLRV